MSVCLVKQKSVHRKPQHGEHLWQEQSHRQTSGKRRGPSGDLGVDNMARRHRMCSRGSGSLLWRTEPEARLPQFGQLGPRSAKLTRNRTSLGRVRPGWRRIRPISTKFGTGSAKFGPNSINFGQHWPGVCHNWLCADQLWPDIGQIRFEVDQSWPELIRHLPGPVSAKLDPNSTKFDQEGP